MSPTADLCRIQEAFERRRAECAPLGNVRAIAQKAAAAWGTEALLAEGREERQALLRAVRANQRERESSAFTQLDLANSENPDCGHASPSKLPRAL